MTLKIDQLNKRQDEILKFIEKEQQVSISKIFDYIQKNFTKTAKITINRDLKQLLKLNLIQPKGRGRSVVYELSPYFNFIKPINIEKYFQTEVDQRKIQENFNFNIFSNFKNIFLPQEDKYLKELTQDYKKNINQLPKDLIKKEFERLAIDLSWKSSQIEGNTYSLLETEQLIKESKESPGHSKQEALMILNHKKTLDFIYKNVNNFKNISLSKIENIHYLLIKDMGIKRNLRKRLVRITGTNYRPLDNQFQIEEALRKTCQAINSQKNYFTKALMLIILISYIQPFEDGNKRTARLVGDAVLTAGNLCPLSFRSVDQIEYKKALILFYEQNNINYFKQIFIEQYSSAVKNYFGA